MSAPSAGSRFVDLAQVREHLASNGPGTALYTPESEDMLLGAILRAPDDCEEVMMSVAGGAFADPISGKVWDIATTHFQTGRFVSPPIIRDALQADAAFEAWGGLGRLENLAETGTAVGVVAHAGAVIDRAQRRDLLTALNGASAKLLDTSRPAEEILLGIERDCAEVAQTGFTAGSLLDAGQMIAGAIAAAHARSGIIEFPFGLHEVDQMTGGLTAGEMTVLGAYTGMGKTMAGLQVAKANASTGVGTIFYSLEMGKDPMAIRLACDVAYDPRAPVYLGRTTNPTLDGALKNKDMNPDKWRRLDEAQAIVEPWPLKFDVRPGLTVAQMESAARRQHREWRRQGIKPGPVFVDHIGKVRPGQGRRGDKTAELSDVSNDLTAMAKRLDVPVVALAQINREVERQGEDKRPQLSHIKQSGAIAEDARLVVLLYRPEYYYRAPMEHEDVEQRSEREAKLRKVQHQLYWIVAKNSNGPQGQVLTFCQAECSAIRGWSYDR